MKLFTHKNERIQQLFHQKISNTIASYEGKNLSEVDKKLLLGLNSKKVVDQDGAGDKMMLGIKEFMLKKVELSRQESEKSLREEEEEKKSTNSK